ncbi:MAG: BMP family ABC transporter substrate-binding protein [Sphaerochaetaceae bacterium]|nr:BMP family ABC transporter substrate-binding protein [Sphaerochaetaceae bacterium]MDD4007543.1 BMP family ABC transporter substrate-binding protein [Sphaerochaetaceae bacterium]MDD4397478.1 BMP family ABC transporter substrate-binding protein [Sphaerochaetaceae bacterium]
MKKITICSVLLALCCLAAFAGGTSEDDGVYSVLVYVTGVTAGSPSYELMVQGAQDFAADNPDAQLKIYESGYNQAEWESQLSDLVSSGKYDIVVSSNPALTDICASVAEKFPNQKFIITDAYLSGNPQIRTYLFNQYEQSMILGYLAGLITTSDMQYANPAKKIGFIAAQEYPLLNKHLVPGFLAGAQLVDPEITVDFRVIGNWYDAAKCGELASSMMASGCDVFATIAGGADTGLFKAAKTNGAYVVYHNIDAYSTAPGIIVGCGKMGQRELVRKALQEDHDGKTAYGEASIVGVAEGYVDFIDTDPLYGTGLSQDVRSRFDAWLADFRAGKIKYELPSLD